ncbi:MAG: hypothetical protein WC755_06160 [Candidatus Woesearchaeota archaeon]|jgi:hypothetical protein
MDGGDGDTTLFADKILGNKLTHVVYFAVLIVLIFLILWQMRSMNQKTEGLIGSGIQDQVFTSGATIRRLGQEFSGTNQGEYTVVHNDELKELIPGVIPSKSERLVNERGEPDFWEISSELNAYKESQVAPMTAEAAAQAAAPSGQEWLASDSVASRVQDELLRQQLYR